VNFILAGRILFFYEDRDLIWMVKLNGGCVFLEFVGQFIHLLTVSSQLEVELWAKGSSSPWAT
jgi:hypothetical protein